VTRASFLTARELGDLLGVSAETVLRWTRRGELPAVRLPSGQLRYDRDALDAWLAAHATTRADGADEKCEQPDAPPAEGHPTPAILRPVSNPLVRRDEPNEED
jgi:excisionase family DNA binding protein